MKKIKQILTALMVLTLMVGNTAVVMEHLEGNENALNAPPFNGETAAQDPRPIGLGLGHNK